MRTVHSLTRLRLAALGIACLVVMAGCKSDSSTSPEQVSDHTARAVNVFTHLADSVSRNGGDIEIGGAYASLAEAVRQAGRISSIVITVDDVPTKFYATAVQTDALLTCPGELCAAVKRVVSLRTLIAWQESDPRRLVQLSSEANGDPIRSYLFPVLVPFVGESASLTFFDGKGSIYFGTSGAQKFDITKSAVPCAPTSERPYLAIYPAPPRCTQAEFFVTFNGKVEPSSFRAAKNTATSNHTFSMSTQSVLGARFDLLAFNPPPPPIVVMPTASLPATLSTTVDSVVTLTLTVSNPTSSPAKIDFSSGQHFDFTILDASTGAPLWVWSADRLFTQALSTEVIPANGALVYTAEWKPTKPGSFIATGTLVSLSHRAAARLAVSVP